MFTPEKKKLFDTLPCTRRVPLLGSPANLVFSAFFAFNGVNHLRISARLSVRLCLAKILSANNQGSLPSGSILFAGGGRVSHRPNDAHARLTISMT